MRNDDRATNDETDREALENLGPSDALLGAASEMIRDAVIAPEHERSDEAEQLLGPDIEGAGLVGAGVEGEEPVDDKVPFIENLDVQRARNWTKSSRKAPCSCDRSSLPFTDDEATAFARFPFGIFRVKT